MARRPSQPEVDRAAMPRAEAAAALGLTPKSISNMLGTGRLRRVGWGLVARAQLEELAAAPTHLRRTPRPVVGLKGGSGGAWGTGRDGPAAPIPEPWGRNSGDLVAEYLQDCWGDIEIRHLG